MTNILTTKLANGQKVLAKETQFGINPVTYMTNKQAEAKVAELEANGIECYTNSYGRVKFIFIVAQSQQVSRFTPEWFEDNYTDACGNCYSDADSGL